MGTRTKGGEAAFRPEQSAAPDRLQRPLLRRSRFRQQVSAPLDSHRWRQEQTEKLLHWIAKNSPDVPHIVVGDLNAGPSSAILTRFKARLRSAFEVVHGQEPAATRAPTWQGPGHELGGVVDYILVSSGIEVLDAWRFCTAPSAEDPTLFPSDHLGLAARVRL